MSPVHIHALCRRACILMMLVILATGAAPKMSMAADARGVVDELLEELWSTFTLPAGPERLDQLSDVIASKTDVVLLGRLAAGRYWRRMDDDQRETYQGLFRDAVIKRMAMRLDGYAASIADQPLGEHVQIIDSQPVGRVDRLVRSTVQPGDGPKLTVDWRLRERENGFVIIDLIVEGVSLLVSQRAEFTAVIERHDIQGLIEELRQRAQASS